MNQLTKEQAIILTGYTNILCCPFSVFQEDVEKRLGRSVFTHEFADEMFTDKVRALYVNDFMNICWKA